MYMGILICNICKKECNELIGLLKHSSIKHKIDSKTIYIDYVLNGVAPVCLCGCGGDAPFISIGKGFSKFIQSHHNRVPGNNNFHKNPETHRKAINTQKKNWELGKYTGWWENDNEETKQKIEGIKKKLRTNKERGKKISDKLLGVPKTDECKQNISISQKERFKNNPKIREIMSETRLIWMRNNSKVKTSKLENTFISLLETLGLIEDIDFIHSHLITKIKTFFDFYIVSTKILIEVDGDFYHCNPNTTHKLPKYEIQKKNLINDKRKNTWCKNNNITLLRYWEKDINERPEWVITDLREKLSI